MNSTGRLLKGGAVVVESVHAYMRGGQAAAAKGWAGELLVPRTVAIRPGEDYRLELADGRAGLIHVAQVYAASRETAVVRFDAAGC